MASIEKRLRDGQVTWRAHYRTPAGAQRNKTFDADEAAKPQVSVAIQVAPPAVSDSTR
jgi:hypothetical protein